MSEVHCGSGSGYEDIDQQSQGRNMRKENGVVSIVAHTFGFGKVNDTTGHGHCCCVRVCV